MSIDPISHAIGQLQSGIEALRREQAHAEQEAEGRHERVMRAIDEFSARMTAVEGVVTRHAEQLTAADGLVKDVERLKQRGAGVLLVLVAAWGGVVGLAAFFKAELVKWWFS